MKLAVFFCMLCMFAVYSAQSASLYKWVDNDGKVHYSEKPPANAKTVEQKTLGTSSSGKDQLPYATSLAAKNFPVALYNSDCDDCTKARDFLTKRGIPFTEKMVNTPEMQAELKKLVGALSVPVLTVGKVTNLKGFNPDAWNSALDDAGYPKTAPYQSAKPKEAAKTDVKGEQKPAKTGEGKP